MGLIKVHVGNLFEISNGWVQLHTSTPPGTATKLELWQEPSDEPTSLHASTTGNLGYSIC